jgi:site-specific recombinase XerD
MVVASSTATRQLAEYFRAFCLCREKEDRLFRNGHGDGIPDQTLYAHYHAALGSAGIGCRESGRLPRIHDLRHTFCVHALESMAAKGYDLYTSLPLLVKYLGHNCISETEYYLRLVGENFTSVTEKSKAYAPSLFPKAGDVDDK